MELENSKLVMVCPNCLYKLFRERIQVPSKGCTTNAVIVAFPQGAFKLSYYKRMYPEYKCALCGERRSVMVIVDLSDIRDLGRPWAVVRVNG